jgi:hypothetical protein
MDFNRSEAWQNCFADVARLIRTHAEMHRDVMDRVAISRLALVQSRALLARLDCKPTYPTGGWYRAGK